MTTEHKDLDYLKGKFEDGDRPTGEDFARLLDSCHNTKQMTDVNITGELMVDGETELKLATKIGETLDVASILTVEGPGKLNSTLDVVGDSALRGLLSVTRGVTLGDVLSVAGNTTLEAGLVVNGPTTLNNTLNVNDTITAPQANINTLESAAATLVQAAITNLTATTGTFDTVNVTSTLTNTGETQLSNVVADTATFNNNVHIKGDLHVDGNAFLSAGASGSINVGDTSNDNIIFNGDVSSNIHASVDAQYDIGSDTHKWNNIYTENIVVDGLVDTRDISADGTHLDSVYASVNTTSGHWNDTTNIVQANSASWEETADINAIINNIGGVSADWTVTRDIVNNRSESWDSTHSTVESNSAQWAIDTNTDELALLTDVDMAGVENNSILRYETSTNKWVASTVEDEEIKATAKLVVYDHGADGEIPLDGLTLVLTDNYQDGAPRTVTFTAASDTLSGTNTKVDSSNYTYGTSGLSAAPVDMDNIATVVADVINLANTNDDLSIYASSYQSTITLRQQYGGAGGNTEINGTSTGNTNEAFLHGDPSQHNPHFAGGASLNTFASLDDTPGSFGGDAGKFVKVNQSNDGLEFIEHNTSDWDTVVTTVNTNSASWEETADINAIVDSIGGVSGNWNSVYTDVRDTSGTWNTTTTTVNTNSGDWEAVYSTVNTDSGDWDTTYTTVSTYSGDWEAAHSTVLTNSANWDAVYTDVGHNRGNWNAAYSDFASVSAQRDLVITKVGETSASWDDVYNYVQTTSGEGYATLDATGKLLTQQIPELSITRVHVVQNPGDVYNLNPAEGIQVGDVVIVVTTFDNLIAVDTTPGDFGTYTAGTESYSGYNKLALPADLVQTINGNTGPHVVLTTDDVNEGATNKYTTDQQKSEWTDTTSVVQSNSASWEETADINAIINNIGGVSANWNDTYTNVSETSANWNNTYTNVSETSANWNDTYTDVSETSASWSNAYTNVSGISASRDDVITEVQTNSGDWNDVYSFVNTDSATNNTDYNQTTFVNASGDTMTGDLSIVGGELTVGGNITLAGDLIHQGDTGTRISYNDDVITLETNSQEYITIDGSSPTPNQVIINNPGSEQVDFIVKAVDIDPAAALFVNGANGRIGVNTETLSVEFTVSGDTMLDGDVELTGNISAAAAQFGSDVDIDGNVSTLGTITSAGTPLHDIFTTSDDIHGDLTVHGSISAQDEIVTSNNLMVSGETITTGDITTTGALTADHVTSLTGYTTKQGMEYKTGITQDVNIGGHVLHIVNGIIVGVTDE